MNIKQWMTPVCQGGVQDSFRELKRSSGPATWRTALFVVVCLAALGMLCPPHSCAEETLIIGGTGGPLRLLEILAEKCPKSSGDSIVVESSLGSSGGLRALELGKINLAVSSRNPGNEYTGRTGSRVILWLRTPLVFVADPNANVDNVTEKQVVEILRGDRVSWPNGRRIRPVLRPQNETDTEMLGGYSEEMAAALGAAHMRPGMLHGISDQDNGDTLEDLPGAFGAMTLLQLRAEERMVKELAFEGISPFQDGYGAGRLDKNYYLVFRRGDSSKILESFLVFIGSEQARDLIRMLGGGHLLID